MSANHREAEYARILQFHREEEDRRARHNLRRRAIKKRDLLHKFQRRRLQNFLKEDEVVGCTRAAPVVPPPPPTTPVRSKREAKHKKRCQIPKDWEFYKRNGFIWSDLGRTPKTRLALVVRPIAVKRERKFIEQLLRKVEAEDALNRQRAKEQLERLDAQRGRLRKKIALNRAQHAQSLAALSEIPGMGKSGTEKIAQAREAVELPGPETCDLGTGHERGERRVVLSTRHEQLACPKKPANGVRSFVVSGSTDLVGLLHANPVLKGFLDWHLEDLRDDMLTSQAALLKQTGESEHALCSVPPPGSRRTASQPRVISCSAEAVGGQRSGGGQKRQLSPRSL